MDYETAKVQIRESKTQAGVYGALERFGVDTSRPLADCRKMARSAMRHKEAEVIQVAIIRLQQIENKEV